MAIHEDVPGVEVTVRCHERPLRELEDPNAQDDDAPACPTMSKYVECVDDTEFDVSIIVGPDYAWGYRNHVLVASLYIDGEYVRGVVTRSKDVSYGIHGKPLTIRGAEARNAMTGLWTLSKFKFAAVKTIDDAPKERVEKDLKTAKDLGTIEVKFTRAIEHGPGYHNYSDDVQSRSFELAEKSLKGKAVSHGTSYGNTETVRTPRYVDARNIPEDNGPILVFRFMYRSKDALRRELIIPRSPSHSPAFENLTPAERDRLARERLNELRGKKIKREDGRVVIKREFGEILDLTQDPPAPRPTKKSRLQTGVEVDVIDLTDD